MRALDCPGDLLARYRRGLTTPSELEAVEQHVAGCAACQLSQKLGADFDSVGLPRGFDDQLIAKYAKLAAATAKKGPTKGAVRRRHPPQAILLAAAALVILAAASAATLLRRQPSPPPAPAQRQGAAVPAAVVPSQAALPATTASGAGELEPSASVVPAPAPPRASAPPAGPPESAATLFAEANQARRSGDTSRAIALYQRLQKRFGESAEAQLSRVTLGRLLLDNGSASAALAQFDGYLSIPNGRLRLEALAGRARSLGALSRAVEERQAWQRLLSEYPDSVYSEKARRRLAELR